MTNGSLCCRIGLVFSCLAFLALCTSARAEIWEGSASDPVDSGVQPGRDILAVEAEYSDASGFLEVEVTTAGPPVEPNSFAFAKYFSDFGAGCTAPVALVGDAYDTTTSAAWVYGSSSGIAYKSVSGNTTRFTASAPALAGQSFRCVGVDINETEPDGTDEVLKDTLPPFPLAPLMQVAPPPPPPPPAVAKLKLVTHRTVKLRRGKWGIAAVVIPNRGTGPAFGVVLKVGKRKGVALKPRSGKMRLGVIPAGKTFLVKFKVRLGRKAKRVSKLPLALTSKNGGTAKSKLVLRLKKHPRRR